LKIPTSLQIHNCNEGRAIDLSVEFEITLSKHAVEDTTDTWAKEIMSFNGPNLGPKRDQILVPKMAHMVESSMLRALRGSLADLAQLVEQLFRKQQVSGSSPEVGSVTATAPMKRAEVAEPADALRSGRSGL
jgi:hypothetical protein